MIVDFHNHVYPQVYLDELARGDTQAKVELDGEGRLLMLNAGDYSIVADGHRHPDVRIEAMDAAGVDLQILTLSTPGVHVESRERGAALARIVNDDLAETITRFPGRFSALAALPLQAPEDAADELERAVTQLRLPGGMLFTNVNGKPIDGPRFWPLYERAADLGAILFIHPTSPAHVGTMADHRLVPLVGFLHETTVAISRLVFSGLFERLPGLKMVLSHLGGTMPYLAERLDFGFEVYPEIQGTLTRPPSETLKQFYMDTTPFTPNAMQFAIDFAGADKLLLGSDYPHQIGDLPGAIKTIRGLSISAEDKARMLGGNAAALLGL
jgi:aminocarboxymuconate-semialdehyde decarboxylase